MITQEIQDFFAENKIKAGDSVFINFRGLMCPESMNATIMNTTLIDGNQIIDTRYGPIKLNYSGPYILIQQHNRGESIQALEIKRINIIEHSR